MVANRGPVTSGVTLALLVVATAFVSARFYTRAFLVRSIKQDDWWILAAWVCAVGFSAAICAGVQDGLGMHWTDIIGHERDDFRRAQYAYSILYNPCLMLTKTSIIIFFLSVMSKDVDPIFRWCNWITLAIVNVAGLALTFLNIFQCRPVFAGYTYPTPPGAKCTDIVTLYLSSAPVNIITDLALLLLPMPILTGLRLPKKQKIILVCTFSAGIFVAVVDIVRIAYLQNASADGLKVKQTGQSGGRILDTSDFSWDASLSFMWSAIEVNLGIICACVPSLKPLFLKFAPNLIKDSGDISQTDSLDVKDYQQQQEPISTFDTDANVVTHPAMFRKPVNAEYAGDDDGDYMGFLNMLSGGPDDDDDSPKSRPSRKATNATSNTLARTVTAKSATSDFGFVRMDKNKNMLKLNNKQSLWAVFVVTVIFFLWGFAYGLLGVLNAQFQKAASLSAGEGLGLQGAYYAGYLIGPLTFGRWFLHRYGFKSTQIAGLCIYGAGTLVFWPSAVLLSYPAFIVSNFLVGFGLSCLEVASNPYIALCGPLEYAEVRLNFSQAFQAVGTVCSPLLANRVLFNNVANNTNSLVGAQWAYLGISLFDFMLAIIFYYIPLPEATAEQLEEHADKRSAVYRRRIGPYRVVWVTLALGVFAQWCYVGAQEGNGFSEGHIIPLLTGGRNLAGLDTLDFQTLERTSFALGRFLGAFLNYLIKPRWLLVACFVASIILCGVQMSVDGGSGLAVNNLIQFFQGSIFPIIYAMCMRGMGDQTFNAAGFMTAAISSGGVVPPIMWAVTNARGVKYSYCVPLAIFVFGSIFPIYLNLMPAAKKQVDPIHENRDRRRRNKEALRTNSAMSAGVQSDVVDEKQFGLAGIIARRRRNHEKNVSGVSFMPNSEHVEHTDSAMSPVSPKNTRWSDNSFASISEPSPVKKKTFSSRVMSIGSRQHDDTPSTGSDDQDATMSGGSGEQLSPVPTQERREWTEEDDIRDDYHKALRGL